MCSYQKRYSSEPWYVAMRREQNERAPAIQQDAERQVDPFLEKSPLFDELQKRDPAYCAKHCGREHSEKIVKVSCRYLEGYLGIKEYRSMSELDRRYGVSEASIRKTAMEAAKILNYPLKKFTKGTRTDTV